MNRAIVLFSKYRDLLPYMVAQAKHETGNFKSKVYMENHNMFGIKWTDGRRGQNAKKGLLSPEGNHYAHYATDSASVFDMILWLQATKFPTQVEGTLTYAKELQKRGYFTDGLNNYVNGLNFYL